ncbi:MAG: hypothetical protein CVU46_06825 [Chloroflexi bacterium HGW-Chloroflexi-8]|nr:MAG: hypothetical protein CVU46_06825 [Chloroflexi bacterium HGW-Chloroflexi-8]
MENRFRFIFVNPGLFHIDDLILDSLLLVPCLRNSLSKTLTVICIRDWFHYNRLCNILNLFTGELTEVNKRDVMSSPTWIGQTLNGRYLIQELLGQGGMSAVYKALDPNLKRVVAIKLIHPHLAMDNQFVQRFEEEAAAVASLRHPNIVQVYDFNTDKDVSYMVLEFLAGETLQDHLKRLIAQNRSMSVEQAIKYTINICDALGYAHQRGMIHRDIKPANIMLDVFGQAILMDFGIVKILGGSQHTATGAVMGTARYMSPELIRSEPADARSDIYSMGVTLYEMLSGKPPFIADSAMTLMMMHLNDPVPDPRNLRADLPPELVRILNKALAKDRNLRYQSTAELIADLKKVQAMTRSDPSPLSADTIIPEAKQSATVNPYGAPLPLDAATLYEQRSVVSPEVNPTPAKGYQAQQFQNGNSQIVQAEADLNGQAEKKNRSLFLFLGIGVAAFLLIIALIWGGISLISNLNKGSASVKPEVATQTEAMAVVEATTPVVLPTETRDINASFNATLTAVAFLAAQSTETPTATWTPAPTEIPTATMPALYVRINGISINDDQRYVVDYETFGYTEQLPGRHVHFFFNTVSPEQAGMPGSGPWILYGGPRPFTGYRVSDKPAMATHMCALVANSDHSIILESGNCFDLP